MENYLNTLVRYRRSVQQQDAESWYDDSSEEYVPDTQTFDYPDVDYSGKITFHLLNTPFSLDQHMLAPDVAVEPKNNPQKSFQPSYKIWIKLSAID